MTDLITVFTTCDVIRCYPDGRIDGDLKIEPIYSILFQSSDEVAMKPFYTQLWQHVMGKVKLMCEKEGRIKGFLEAAPSPQPIHTLELSTSCVAVDGLALNTFLLTHPGVLEVQLNNCYLPLACIKGGYTIWDMMNGVSLYSLVFMVSYASQPELLHYICNCGLTLKNSLVVEVMNAPPGLNNIFAEKREGKAVNCQTLQLINHSPTDWQDQFAVLVSKVWVKRILMLKFSELLHRSDRLLRSFHLFTGSCGIIVPPTTVRVVNDIYMMYDDALTLTTTVEVLKVIALMLPLHFPNKALKPYRLTKDFIMTCKTFLM
jgi:hypothetical protein